MHGPGNAPAHRKPYRNVDGDRGANRDRLADSGTNCDGDSGTNRDGDGDANGGTDVDTNAHPNGDPNPHPNGDPNPHPNPHRAIARRHPAH
ncbi:hypothetical protein ACIPY1_14670 [Paenarthrobacter nicotinovorans]|uniref:hypothetical protein n=1 Tax=Paenarthrobacter nicotinovorans TaxID=29320 RepID=UPI0037FCAEAB